MKFEGDIIITDPCYIIREKDELTGDDWGACVYGDCMQVLGIQNYLASDTLIGDWSWRVFDKETKKELGRYCADAGMVGVFLLEEVLAYNPSFDYHINKPWTTTLIKDFDGEINLVESEEREQMEVIGEGNINFFSR